MKQEFRLADIGEGLEEAEIVAWRVKVGDRVERDQALVEVMTDKSNADLPAPWSGVVVAVGGAVGDMIKVGEVVAVIDDDASSTGAAAEPRGAFGAAVRPAPEATFFADTAAASPIAATTPPPSPPVADPVTPEPTPPPVADPVAAVAPEPAPPAAVPAPTIPSAQAPAVPRRAKASPTTRREAVRRGIDIAQIAGSGPGGRVLLSDLDASGASPAPSASLPAADMPPTQPQAQPQAAQPPPPPPAAAPADATSAVHAAAQTPEQVQPLRGVRRLIARNMTKSWTEVPHIHAWREIDAEPLMELRTRLRDSGRDHYATVTPLAFFVSAVAHGLRTFPITNASLDLQAETITTHPHVNVGIAVASPQGLVVPVIRNADQLSLSDTAAQISELVARARSGDLGAEAFRGGTATITNFGSLGGENATPILRPPESVIVGFGSIASRPFVIDDQVVARKTMHVVVAADHRLLDGDVTTAFLNHVCERLIDPIDLALGL